MLACERNADPFAGTGSARAARRRTRGGGTGRTSCASFALPPPPPPPLLMRLLLLLYALALASLCAICYRLLSLLSLVQLPPSPAANTTNRAERESNRNPHTNAHAHAQFSKGSKWHRQTDARTPLTTQLLQAPLNNTILTRVRERDKQNALFTGSLLFYSPYPRDCPLICMLILWRQTRDSQVNRT